MDNQSNLQSQNLQVNSIDSLESSSVPMKQTEQANALNGVSAGTKKNRKFLLIFFWFFRIFRFL